MKHKNKSASPGELACPHLSDHPTQEAKPKQKNDRGRSVSFFCPRQRGSGFFCALDSKFFRPSAALRSGEILTSARAKAVSVYPRRSRSRTTTQDQVLLPPFLWTPLVGLFFIYFSSAYFRMPQVIDSSKSCGASSDYNKIRCIRRPLA